MCPNNDITNWQIMQRLRRRFTWETIHDWVQHRETLKFSHLKVLPHRIFSNLVDECRYLISTVLPSTTSWLVPVSPSRISVRTSVSKIKSTQKSLCAITTIQPLQNITGQLIWLTATKNIGFVGWNKTFWTSPLERWKGFYNNRIM